MLTDRREGEREPRVGAYIDCQIQGGVQWLSNASTDLGQTMDGSSTKT